MKRDEAEQKQIVIYWWNMGTKILDFEGNYKDYFGKMGIKIRNISRYKKIKGLRFKFSMCTTTFTIDSYDSDIVISFDVVIKTYLTYLEDKAEFNNGYGREYKINWR